MSLVLNAKQKLACEKIVKFVSQNAEKMFYLLGYGGTGKTFLMAKMMNQFLVTGKMDHIYVCAPTHQALNVIESYLRENLTIDQQIDFLSKISFMTIHKLLDFKPIIMTSDGSKIFKPLKESKFLKQMQEKLIVIDECSMISKEMVANLKKYAELYPIKIIFMGDRHQLPPVCEPESLIFSTIPTNYEYYILLDEMMRTRSSDIKDVCGIIRDWDRKSSLSKLLLPVHNRKTSNKTFRLYHKRANYEEATWFKNIIKKLEKGVVPIILTWRNETSDWYNQVIRNYVHKSKNLKNFRRGDFAIFSNYYSSPEDGTSFYTADMIKIHNISTEERVLFDWSKVTVEEPKTLIDKFLNKMLKKLSKQDNKFRVDSLTVKKINRDAKSVPDDNTYLVQTIYRDDLEKYNAMLEHVQEHIEFFFKKYKSDKLTTKLWDIYHKKLVDPYAQIKFGYSLTVHKAQGSTFEDVMVDADDICANMNIDEMQKSLYTAAARASDQLGFLLGT